MRQCEGSQGFDDVTASTGEFIFRWNVIANGNKSTYVTFFPPSPLCSGRYAQLQSEFASAVQTSVEQKSLILKLEHDLSTVQAMSSLPRPDAEGSEVGTMENIPEPVKEATAMFAGVQKCERAGNLTIGAKRFYRRSS